jgi:hypothetical protein
MRDFLKGRAWWEWVLVAGFLATFTYSPLGELLGWDGYRSRVGEQCGPSHHWVYVTAYPDAELSCEPD